MNKMVNKHTADYHPIPSESTSRIHPLIFLWALRVFSLTNISWIFCQTCISHHACRNFWIYGIILLLENKFVSQKIEFLHFYSYPPSILPPGFYHHHSRQKKHISTEHCFLEIYFSPAERGDYGAEKMTKIKLAKVLITSFNKFHHFCNDYIFGFCFIVP